MARGQPKRQVRQGRAQAKHATFSVSAALFEELGERLVSRPEIALAELIKNSYDADSPYCRLSLTGKEILVQDHGHGMTEGEFLGNWMVISSQIKSKQRFSRHYGRNMAGSKGIGRFSARFLGSVVELTTVAHDPKRGGALTKLTAVFDWRKIAQQQTIGQVTIDYFVSLQPKNESTGTTLRITQLRDEATSIAVAQVKTDILRLTDPAAGLEPPPFTRDPAELGRQVEEDPGFSVVFAEGPAQAGEVEPNVAAQILDAFTGRVRVRVTAKGRLSYKVYWNRNASPIASGAFALSHVAAAYAHDKLTVKPGGKVDARGLPAELEQISHLPLAAQLHSPVFIDIRFFPRRAGTFSGLPVNGRTAQRWVSDNASLAIVDNTFAMPAYTDRDSDWLGVDASKARNERSWQSVYTPAIFPISAKAKSDPGLNPMLALPRGSQLIGRVHIATRKRPAGSASDEWLQPNMDRESLRDNGAYRLLWHVSRFAVELLAHFDRAARLKEEQRASRENERQARTALSEAIEQVKTSQDIDPAHRRRIVAQLQAAQERFRESTAYERDSRISLELMSMMGVMAGFMTHEFEKMMSDFKDAADLLDHLASKSAALAESAASLRKSEQALANFVSYMRLFISKARNPQAQTFKARGQISLAVKTLGSVAEAHGIYTELSIDPKLPGPEVPLAAYNGVVINLVSNAMKALVAKVSDQPRRIQLSATNDGMRHILICADNGIGIPEYLRARIWDPLFTTTGDDDNPLGSGLGLGLSVVSQVVKGLNGRVELLEKAPPGFTTAFRVSLPLTA